MTAKEIQRDIEQFFSHLLFRYKGKPCGVDPISRTRYDMWYGESFGQAKSLDEVMNMPFFDGKSLNEIAENITDIEQ